MILLGIVITNPFIFFVALLQIGAAPYSLWTGDYRIAVITGFVGVANLMLSTMNG